MSGSRRHRVNLNAQVNSANFPQRQVSQPQPAPLPILYPPPAPIAGPTQHQFPLPAPINMTHLPPSHVETVHHIQRSFPQSQTPSMMQHRPMPQGFAAPTTSPTTSSLVQSSLAQPRPVVSTSEFLVDRLMSALNPILAAHQESTSAQVKKLETFLETLSSQIKDIRSDSQAQTMKFAEALKKSFTVQQSASQGLNNRMERLEKTLGTSFDREDDKSLLNRLDTISFAVEELLERAKDPDALLSEPAVPNQVEESNPFTLQKQVMDVGIDAQTSPPRTPPPPKPIPPLRVEFGTSPLRLAYTEVAINPQTPRPEPELPRRCEMGTSPTRHTYLDVGIDSQTPIPEPLSQPALIYQEASTSPRRQVYLEVGTSARTPEPQRSPRTFSSAGVATSPSNRFSPGMFRSRRFSSDAVTLVGDISCPEVKSMVEYESPKTARIDIRSGTNEGKDGGTPEDDIPGVEGSGTSSPGMGVRSHFGSVSSLSKPMSPVDWSRKADDNDDSSNGDSDDEVVPVFRPDASPERIQKYSLLKETEINKPTEGTIAALRQEALGDFFTGPVLSSPPRPVAPFHSRPSVSPLPSPAHTPSPTPVHKHTYSSTARLQVASPAHVAPAQDVGAGSLEEIQSSFSAGYAAHSLGDPIQSSFTDNSLSRPVAPPTLDEIQSFFPGNSPAPDSEDESELSVTRLVTETFANLEEPFPESRPPSLPPSRTRAPLFTRASESPAPATEDRDSPPLPLPKVAGVKRRLVVSLSRSVSPVERFKKERLVSNKPNPKQPKPTAIVKLPPAKPAGSTPPATPQAIFVQSSPIYISSRSPSPLSELTSDSEDLDADLNVHVVPAKKEVKIGKKETGSVAQSQSQPPPQRKKVLNLKATQPGTQSAAVTRVKKRKSNPLEAMEPPLKRARQKEESVKEVSKVSSKEIGGKEREKSNTTRGKAKEKSNPSTVASTSKGKIREKRSSSHVVPGVKWPKKPKDVGSTFNMTFVACDVCDIWYHYGCVGIVPDDVRVKLGEIFTCPPCMSNGANALVAKKDDTCGRPDCVHKQKQPYEFFVSGILGRATKVQSGQGRRYIWLVKWDGYPVDQCTWEEEGQMSNPEKLIQEFYDVAQGEGFEPEEDPHSPILLKEAVDGGLKDPTA